MKKHRLSAFLLTFTLLFTLFSGCGGNAATDASMPTADGSDRGVFYSTNSSSKGENGAYAEAEDMSTEIPMGGGSIEAQASESAPEETLLPTDGRKIIRTAFLQIETTDFDVSLDAVTKAVGAVGGWVQNSSIDGPSALERYGYRSASYVLRIPSASLEAFLSGASAIGNVLSSSIRNEEVTDQYFDTEARLSTLKIQQERLLAILEKAESLTDVITLEQALSDVLYEIESLTGTLRKYDSLIAYSTVELSLEEVYTPTTVTAPPKNMGERAAQAFSNSLLRLRKSGENFVVWLAGNVIVLLVWIVFLFVAIWVLRKVYHAVRRRRIGSAPPSESSASPASGASARTDVSSGPSDIPKV